MEDLDQEPEEIPMDEVLAEIRHMLSQNVEKKDTPIPSKTEQFVEKEVLASQKEPDYFLLTPEMRCDLGKESQMAAVVQKQKERVLNKLQQKPGSDSLSPELIAWLNDHLPAMIEKVLENKK